jgi:hypothetical protein
VSRSDPRARGRGLHRFARLSALILPCLLASCMSEKMMAPNSTGQADDLSDVIYEGVATDEALLALLAATVEQGPGGTVFDEPAEGVELAVATAPRFAWHVSASAEVRPAPSSPTHGRRLAQRERSLLESFSGAVSATAWAHGPPVNGRAYFLVLSAPNRPEALRVFTTELEYTPAAEVWQGVGTGDVTATIRSAIFENNRVPAGGGPFEGQPLHVRVGP